MKIVLNGNFLNTTNLSIAELRKNWLFVARKKVGYLSFDSLKSMVDILFEKTEFLTKEKYIILEFSELNIPHEDKAKLEENCYTLYSDFKSEKTDSPPVMLDRYEQNEMVSFFEKISKEKEEIKGEILSMVLEDNKEKANKLIEELISLSIKTNGPYG